MGRSVNSMKLSAKSELLTFVIGAALFAAAGGFAWWTMNGGGPAAAQGPARPERAVAVSAARAELRNLPFRVDAVGTVQPMVSVAVRSRVDSQVDKVQFADGALVKEGELLFSLDSRAIEAQIRQADATLARDKALLEKAERDLVRISGLVDKGTYTPVQLADARTNVEVLQGHRRAGRGDAAELARAAHLLRHLRAGHRPCRHCRRPPRRGHTRIGHRRAAHHHQSDGADLCRVRRAGTLRRRAARRERQGARHGVPAGHAPRSPTASVAFIDNTVDVQTGTIMVRARFGNKDETLWPGTLVGVQMTLRVDDGVVTVPNEAIQSGQKGTFVFVVENNLAKIRPVTVARSVDGVALVAEGLKAGEIVVTDGQLSLRDGIRVDIKRTAGSLT